MPDKKTNGPVGGGSAEQTAGGAGGTKQGRKMPNLGERRGQPGANKKHGSGGSQRHKH